MRWWVFVVALTSCRDDEVGHFDATQTFPGASLGQSGAQDAGLFRSILERGDLPGPNTIDAVGFFAEHAVDLPAPDCGEDVCLHALFGALGNMITGAECTVVLLGFNTPIDPATLPVPPLDLTLVIDTSQSMKGEPIDTVRAGIALLGQELGPDDRVNLVSFADEAVVIAEGLSGSAIGEAKAQLLADDNTNIHDGLRVGYELAEATRRPEALARLVLLSDGAPTTGIRNTARMLALAEGYAAAGISTSTIGLGDAFDATLIGGLAERGGGAFTFVESPDAAVDVFVEEARWFLHPIATDVELTLRAAPGWHFAGLYGSSQATVEPRSAMIHIPALHVAHRRRAEDAAHGRRGGGGAILLEVLPDTVIQAGGVADLALTYLEPDGSRHTQSVGVAAPDGSEGGWFADASVEKGFVMLNLYMGFRMAAESTLHGDHEEALSVLVPLRTAVDTWLASNWDEDIVDDLRYVDMFITNLQAVGAVYVPDREPREPWPRD